MQTEHQIGLPPESVIDIAAVLQERSTDGPLASVNSAQLHVNLLRLPTGDRIAEHVAHGLDVVFVVFEGSGELSVDGEDYPLEAGRVLVVSQGARRALHCTAGPLVYLTCHRRRAGLMPE